MRKFFKNLKFFWDFFYRTSRDFHYEANITNEEYYFINYERPGTKPPWSVSYKGFGLNLLLDQNNYKGDNNLSPFDGIRTIIHRNNEFPYFDENQLIVEHSNLNLIRIIPTVIEADETLESMDINE